LSCCPARSCLIITISYPGCSSKRSTFFKRENKVLTGQILNDPTGVKTIEFLKWLNETKVTNSSSGIIAALISEQPGSSFPYWAIIVIVVGSVLLLLVIVILIVAIIIIAKHNYGGGSNNSYNQTRSRWAAGQRNSEATATALYGNASATPHNPIFSTSIIIFN